MTENEVKETKFDGRIGLLIILAEVVNPSDDFEVGITLNVQGTIVSGIMISARRYYETMGKLLTEANKGRGNDEIKKAFDELSNVASKHDGKEYNMIYLKDVIFFTGQKLVPQRSTYWIGKIASVDGFIFGNLSPDTPQSY
jgi:hypothetical protein